MKPLQYCILLSVCLCLCPLYAQTYNNMRVAYSSVGANGREQIPAGFYKRAQAAGFNYVLAEFVLDTVGWDTGRYIGNANTGIRKRLKDEFVAADKHGMKLIPLFQTSDIHSMHWTQVRNTHIQWQRLPTDIPKPTWDLFKELVPTFAPDSMGVFGFDSSFNQLLNVIYSAFNAARASNGFSNRDAKLEYIHFGADEPMAQFSIDGVRKTVVMAGLCPSDTAWLKNNGYKTASVQNQIIALLGSNIKRKVQMITAAGKKYGHNNIKALYYGDMLDPNHLGGSDSLCSFSNLFDVASVSTTPVKTYSLASNNYVKAVRDSSIVVQWNYDSINAFTGLKYNTESTFQHFTTNKLRFLHGNELANKNDPVNGGRFHHFMEQVVVGADPKFNNYLKGFVSFHWTDSSTYFHGTDLYNQATSYKTMEFLSHILWHNAALFE